MLSFLPISQMHLSQTRWSGLLSTLCFVWFILHFSLLDISLFSQTSSVFWHFFCPQTHLVCKDWHKGHKQYIKLTIHTCVTLVHPQYHTNVYIGTLCQYHCCADFVKIWITISMTSINTSTHKTHFYLFHQFVACIVTCRHQMYNFFLSAQNILYVMSEKITILLLWGCAAIMIKERFAGTMKNFY